MPIPAREPAKQKITLREYAELWIATECGPPFHSRHLQAIRRRAVNGWLLPTLGDLELETLRPHHVGELQRTLFGQKLSQSSVEFAITSVLRPLWKSARRRGIVAGNPFEDLSWPRRRWEMPDPFTEREEAAILRYLRARNPYWYLWVAILLMTGCRPSEASGLRWCDYDASHRRLTIARAIVGREVTSGKTARSLRTIALPEKLAHLIDDVRPVDPDPFALIAPANAEGEPMDSLHWGSNHWRKVLDGAHVRYRRLYNCRVTYISRALTLGAPVQHVAEYVGSSGSKIDKHYAKFLGRSDLDPITAALEAKRAIARVDRREARAALRHRKRV